MDREKAFARLGAAAELIPDFNALTATGGRLVGTGSEALARDWLQQRLQKIPEVRLGAHSFNYSGWASTYSSFELVTRAGSEPLPCHPLYWAAATPPGGLEATLIDVGRGSETDFLARADAIPGCIVMVRHEYQFSRDTIHRRLKYRKARECGAAAFVIVNHNPGDLLVTGACSEDSPQNIPAIGVSAATGSLLAAVAEPLLRLRIDTVRRPATGLNLIAEVAGQSSEWVVLCAHYDGHDLAQSALDNATGVVAALAIFESLRDCVPTLRRGLRVILFTAEETGLTGSRLYLQSLKASERQEIALAINLDTIAGDPHLTCLTSGFDELEKFVSRSGIGPQDKLSCYQPLIRNSDHFNFAQAGIPAMRVIAGFDEPQSGARFLLTEADTGGRVSMDELRHAVMVVGTLVWSALEWPDRIAAHKAPAAGASIT